MAQPVDTSIIDIPADFTLCARGLAVGRGGLPWKKAPPGHLL